MPRLAPSSAHTASDTPRWEVQQSRHIRLVDAPGKVLGVSSISEGAILELQEYSESSVGQRWVLENGYIQTAMDASLVLTAGAIDSEHAFTIIITRKNYVCLCSVCLMSNYRFDSLETRGSSGRSVKRRGECCTGSRAHLRVAP